MALRIKPHFAPVTSRSCFSPERVLCAATFASRTVFEPEGPVLNAPGRPSILPSDKETSLGGGSPRFPLISKPKDANRLSEGHNLRKFCLTQFQWDEAQFYEIQEFIADLVDRHLDQGESRTRQPLQALQLVYNQATMKYPSLKQCDNNLEQSDKNFLVDAFITKRLTRLREQQREQQREKERPIDANGKRASRRV